MAGNSAQQTETALQQDSLTTIANVSRLLRQALGALLPTSPDQYMTIAVPGAVIDTTDVDRGGTFAWDVTKHAFAPIAVRQAESTLVDGMMPLANVMLGNTGKSVARSYSRALDGLIPVKASVGEDGLRSPGVQSYDDAMTWLTKKDPETGLTPVDVYNEKQEAWAAARTAWQTAKTSAQRTAEDLYPPSYKPGPDGIDYIGKQTQYFNEWNQENYLRYKTTVQAKWMDWVANGNKYNVEYYFGMVDVDSIMARVEASKESMRNNTIVDADGSNELFAVNLLPKTWATLCKRKAEGWWQRNGSFTLSQLDAEMSRLQTLRKTYVQLQTYSAADAKDRAFPAKLADGSTLPTAETANTDLQAKIVTLYEKEGALNAARWNNKAASEIQTAVTAVATARSDVATAQKTYDTALAQAQQYQVLALTDDIKPSVDSWITNSLAQIDNQLAGLAKVRQQKAKDNPVTLPLIVGVDDSTDNPDEGNGDVLAPPGSELAAPVFGLDKSGSIIPPPPAGGTQNAEDADPWTSISFSYSASDQKKSSQESSWGMSVGGSVGWGLWSVGGSYSHDETHASMQSDMAQCDVSITFSALVVNVNRPWLYGELFSDFELETAVGVNLSPGPQKLQDMIKSQTIPDLALYDEFPAYPTAFVVAADTTIEFNGSTSHIESAFNSHSNSGGLSVGYGPWSVSSSFHESGQNKSAQMHSTATGCKLVFGAPQVIGWVSQILPALPRPQNYSALTQGAGSTLPGSTPLATSG